jgi:excisionase family DNA binding protein
MRKSLLLRLSSKEIRLFPMADINEFPHVEGYVSIKQAAGIIGVSESRVYRFIETGRLKAVRSGHTYIIPIEVARGFRPKPSGRIRTRPTPWREYKSQSNVLGWDIQVHILPGSEDLLARKLEEARKQNTHTFPGTMARYVMQHETEPRLVNIWLVWKDTELTDRVQLQRDLEAFKTEYADVLDWETARVSTLKGLLYT